MPVRLRGRTFLRLGASRLTPSRDGKCDQKPDEIVPYEALHIYEADEPTRELVPALVRSEWPRRS